MLKNNNSNVTKLHNKKDNKTDGCLMDIIGLFENETICETPYIKSLKAECGEKFYDEVFKFTDAEGFIYYEFLDDFVDLVYTMAEDYADEVLSDVIITFVNKETKTEIVGIHAFWDYDEENDDVNILYHLIIPDNEDENGYSECIPFFEFEGYGEDDE